jgi:hypothetical protein
VIVIVALSFMATLAFGNFSYDFSSFARTLSKLLQLLVGGKIYQKDIYFSQSPIGPLFVFLYTVFTSVILVNMLLSILIESFSTSRKHIDPQHLDDLRLALFMKNHIRTKLFYGQEKVNKLLRKTLLSSHKGEFYAKCDRGYYHDMNTVEMKEIQKEHLKMKKGEKLCKHSSRERFPRDIPFDCISCLSDEKELCEEEALKDVKGSLAEISNILRNSISDEEIPYNKLLLLMD